MVDAITGSLKENAQIFYIESNFNNFFFFRKKLKMAEKM